MVDAGRVLGNLEELRTLTGDEFGAQRVAWSPVWLKARAWFEEKLEALPVEHHYDAAGNHWVTLRGDSERALVMGSHLDSVPNGGWLDGCLGVIAGLEVLTDFAERYEGRPPMTVKLVDWADEEGARFGRSLFGSAAFAGKATIAADRARVDRDGVTLEAALAACGVEVDRVSEAVLEQVGLAAYLELHIEQGPILERLGKPLAVVQGTKGVERWAITFRGQEAHSGSTPMEVRRDALAAAAKLALEIRPIAKKHPQAVATMGMRDLDAEVLAGMLDEARAASARFASEEGCTVEWSKIWSIEPIPFSPELIALCEEAIVETVRVSERLPSGPLHDAAEVARLGIPTVMMFVQSLNGLSHNAAENTEREHLEQAAAAFGLLAEKTMAWAGEREAAS
jgi:N-carbamoyl-L-amino-acid hydrolase